MTLENKISDENAIKEEVRAKKVRENSERQLINKDGRARCVSTLGVCESRSLSYFLLRPGWSMVLSQCCRDRQKDNADSPNTFFLDSKITFYLRVTSTGAGSKIELMD
ncbi:hypothetical protein V1477_012048 [Vespula maculifrons]|uniref:Uncharacterized protein n=1 Tax=Vespula maculifrons TaxID=7453 RepID=A0ABD2C1N4_VESMC